MVLGGDSNKETRQQSLAGIHGKRMVAHLANDNVSPKNNVSPKISSPMS
jgi:hypothetical protein